MARRRRLARLRQPLHRAVSSLPAGRELSALRGGSHRGGSLPPLGERARRAVSRARRPLPAGSRSRVPASRGGARPHGRARLLVLDRPGFPPARRALKLARARQVALALERAHLAVAEQDLRERLSFLGEATALLTSSLDLERPP